jgi:hypothetical protein
VARNAFALALLTALALAGCSKLDKLPLDKLPFLGNKKAKEAEVNMAALRARTDSLRKARRVAELVAQGRYIACADSVRAEMTRVVVKAKKRQKKQPAPPSEELIISQVQTVCAQGGSAPQPTLATGSPTAAKPRAADNGKSSAADSVKTPAPKPAAAPAPEAAPQAVTRPDSSLLPATQDAAWADSVRRAKEMEMSRETFAYSGATRDPFNSVLNMAKSGPELADLQLVGIYQNLRAPTGSVAIFREKNGGKRHKLRAGDQLGRSRLLQIRERDVVFMIEDFGFERQETLSLRKQEDLTP